MKVLIAVPTSEFIFPDVIKALWDLDKPEDAEVKFTYVRGYDCARARNKIVEAAEGYEYVLMVDSDTILPKDALVNLLSHNEDVVLGYYAHRNFSKEFTGKTNLCKLGEFNYTNQYLANELKVLKEQGTYKLQVHGGGLGCALIRMSVFKKLEYPYFDWVNYDTGYVLSEDLFFDERCRTAGVPIYADTRVACGHIFRYEQKV